MFCEGSKTYDKPGECPVCHMKLKKQTSEQVSVTVKPVGGGTIEAGKLVNLLWTLKDPHGMQVKDVEIVHEMPLHLLMVSKDLSWYAHEHPKLEADGTFTMTWTFPSGGDYTLFHDFTPKDVRHAGRAGDTQGRGRIEGRRAGLPRTPTSPRPWTGTPSP